MSVNDRSIGLSDLASRAQSAPQKRQRSDCRNPECVNGMTPGLVASGGGNKAQPLFGAGGVGAKRLMKWSWVSCLACNRSDDQRKAGAAYRDLHLSDAEVAQRAQMANSKAPYQQTERETLSKLTVRNRPAAQDGFGPGSADGGKLTELLTQNKQLNERLAEMLKQNVTMTDTLSRMSMQIAALLKDNAEMRLELAKASTTPLIRENITTVEAK